MPQPDNNQGMGLGDVLLPALALGGAAYGGHRFARSGLLKKKPNAGMPIEDISHSVPPPVPKGRPAVPAPPGMSEAPQAVANMQRSVGMPAQEPPDLATLLQMQRSKMGHYEFGKFAALHKLGL